MAIKKFGDKIPANVVDNSSGKTWIMQVTSQGAVLNPATSVLNNSLSAWNQMGYVQGSKISGAETAFSETDDSGKDVVSRSTLKSVKYEGTLLERSMNIRNMPINTANNYYSIFIEGATLADDTGATKTEVMFLPLVSFNQTFDYEIGGKARWKFSAAVLPLSYQVDCASGYFNALTGAATSAIKDAGSVSLSATVGTFYVTKDI